MNDEVKIIILAAGQGTRMKSDLPKVLVPIRGKPMIKYLLEAVENSCIDNKPVIVVGHKKEEIMKTLGDKYEYVVQDEQLGTGHAVMTAEKTLKGVKNIIVLQSDHPFLKGVTIKKLLEKHLESKSKATIATAEFSDFKDWKSVFFKTFSRIIRNEDGKIIRDIQFRDASEAEKEITEVNPGYYCFNGKWLWEKLKILKTDNAQKQYYLPDLIKIAINEGERLESLEIDLKEALTANSKEELDILEKIA